MGAKKKAPDLGKLMKTSNKNQSPPVSVHGPFGNATYNRSTGYTFDSPLDAGNKALMRSAQSGFQGSLDQVNDPNAAIQQATDAYRNMMVPQFERQQAQGFGKAVAGLGKRYAGTFGQLTMNDRANQDALGRATLEKNIYDAGQSQYSNMINNAKNMGSLYTTAQTGYLQPYDLMGQLISQGQGGPSNSNTATAGLLGSYLQAGASSGGQSGGQTAAQIAQTLATLAGAAAKAGG